MFREIYSENFLKLYIGDFPIDEVAKEKINPSAILLRDFNKRSTTNKFYFLFHDLTNDYKKVYFPNSDINNLSNFFEKDPEIRKTLESYIWDILYEEGDIIIKKSKAFYNNPIYVIVSINGNTITCNPYKDKLSDILTTYFKNNIEQFNSISNYFSEAIRNSIQNEEEENENN